MDAWIEQVLLKDLMDKAAHSTLITLNTVVCLTMQTFQQEKCVVAAF